MSVRELGSYNTSGTRTRVRFVFSTHASAGGNVAPLSAFEAADLRIYRANDSAAYSDTQRSSANGVTMTSPFDTLTGVHGVDIDLTDNTDAGFYAAGYRYSVVLAPDETVDSQTLTGVVLAEFEIGPPPVNVTQFGGTALTSSGGRPEVNTTHWSGTANGAPDTAGYPKVTIKDGTGTGELDTSSGAVILTAAYDAAKTAATQASVDTIDNLIDNEIADIITTLATITGLINTEIADIKAKTDNLPSDPADQSALAALIDAVDNFVDTEIATALAALVKIQAAVYDSAPVSGAVITLSNGATQTISGAGRVTA